MRTEPCHLPCGRRSTCGLAQDGKSDTTNSAAIREPVGRATSEVGVGRCFMSDVPRPEIRSLAIRVVQACFATPPLEPSIARGVNQDNQ